MRKRLAISLNITPSRVTFSGPESAVDMEVTKGYDGRPVQILSLPSPAYQDYAQFRSVSHEHRSAGRTFSHSGTHGFPPTMDAGSKE